jgi:hypothetical protein
MNANVVAAYSDDGLTVKRGNDSGNVRCCPVSAKGRGGESYRGHVLEAKWTSPDGRTNSSSLFVPREGRALFSPGDAFGLADRVNWCADKKPYSPHDPLVDAWRISSALAGVGNKGWEDVAATILPVAEKFVSERFDAELLELPIGRRPTLSEYAFLSENPERSVAVTALPFLLPYLVSGLAKSDSIPAANLLHSVDAGSWDLLETVAEEFGVDVGTVRHMHRLPAWLPSNFFHAIGSAETDPACYARALSLLEPSARPDGSDWQEFERLVKWVELMLWDSLDFPERRAVPEAVAAIWAGRRAGVPLELPHHFDMYWRKDLVNVADRAIQGSGGGFAGTLQGRSVVRSAGVWTLLAMLVATDPEDLRYPYSTDLESIRDVFGYAAETYGLVRVAANREGARK